MSDAFGDALAGALDQRFNSENTDELATAKAQLSAIKSDLERVKDKGRSLQVQMAQNEQQQRALTDRREAYIAFIAKLEGAA